MKRCYSAILLDLNVAVARTVSVGTAQGSQKDDLRNDNNHQAKDGSNSDSDDLDFEHNNTVPSRLGEAGPGITNGGIASTTDNNRLDAAVERAIERNNSVSLGGEERGLDTDENNVGRNLDGDLEEDSQDHNAENATLVTIELGNLLAILVQSVERAKTAEGDDLRSSPENNGRPPSGEEGGLERRNSLVPSKLRLGSNNDVDPGGAELDTDKRADQVGDDKRVRSDVVETAVDESETESLDNVHPDAAVHGTETTSGSKKAEGSAEGRSNGLALASGGSDRNIGRVNGLGHVVVGDRLDRERSVSGRLLIFDDGENREDLLESVLAKNHNRDEEDKVGHKDKERPLRKLVELMAKIRLGHVITPHERRHCRFGKHG